MLKATQWPKARSGRVVLCVLGRDPFGAAWRSIEGRPIGKSRLDVAPVQAESDFTGCDALLLGTSERAQMAPDPRRSRHAADPHDERERRFRPATAGWSS